MKFDYKSLKVFLETNPPEILQTLESEALEYCEQRITKGVKENWTVQDIVTASFAAVHFQECNHGIDDPINIFQRNIIKKVMEKYNLILISEFKDLQAGDKTPIKRVDSKNKNISYIQTVDVLNIINKSSTRVKAKVRQTGNLKPNLVAPYDHVFKSDNFIVAVRESTDIPAYPSPQKYKFFFFQT